jgi:methionyl-tRNA formyltransferase
LLLKILPDYVAEKLTPQPQDNSIASYARKISKADGRIDWLASAPVIRNRIRAFTPWPGAYADLTIRGKPRVMKFWRASVELSQGQPGQILKADAGVLVIACASDALRIDQLQIEGGRKMTASEFLAGHPLNAGAFWK